MNFIKPFQHDKVPNPISPNGKGRASQEFKDDADINSIMRKFSKQEAIEHYRQYGLQYGEQTPADLQLAINNVREAERMFADLPSNVRDHVNNDPVQFLEFVQDGSNLEQMREFGLAPTKAPPASTPPGSGTPVGAAGTDDAVRAEGPDAGGAPADPATPPQQP